MKKLKKLLEEVPLNLYRGSKEIDIYGISSHSKRVAPGDLFIATHHCNEEKMHHIEEAIQSGASAILTDMGNPFFKETVQLLHPHPKEVEGALAAAFYGHPSRELFNIGVTGTSGKTTTTYLIKYLLDQLQMPCGLIGTIEYSVGNHRYPAERTTPDVIANHKMLKEMCTHHCSAMVMEVSSHGLDQGRVDRINFDVAIFTNLSQDHLDYHPSMEAYADAKALLFKSLSKEATAVVSLEDSWGSHMMKECKAQILTYGFSPHADLYAHHIQFDSQGTFFNVTYQKKTLRVQWKQIGRFNVLNCLAAFGALLSKGVAFDKLPSLVTSFPGVLGRLERVGQSSIFVDYAHKPDALEKVLHCLQEIKQGRLITLFGCGGDRDRGKRPLMAKIAERLSDVVIVTSDNPRSEDPLAICTEIIAGFEKESKYFVEIDRKKAIQKAIQMAEKDDLILIAGKGHETYQIFAHQTIPFDDRKIAHEFLTSAGKST